LKRYPAFDPPEYVEWEADERLIREFRERLDSFPDRSAVVSGLSDEALVELYRGLVRFRLHDVALKRWVKRGIISKAWLGTGEEAVTIGAVHALRRGPGGDVVAPMIRNAGACHEMGMSVADLLRAYLATGDAPTRGRDVHVGDPSLGVVAPISMVGSVSTVVNGYALAFRMRGEDRVALTWIGDGSTKAGEVHEALNFAAVMNLPVVFVIQNNQIALGTPLRTHHRAGDFSGWGAAYGMNTLPVDGNNVLDVYAAATLAVGACRAGQGPVMLVADTFRMGGHATHDEREARQQIAPQLFREWGKRDPVGLYEAHLYGLGRPLSPPGRPGGDGVDPAKWNRSILQEVEEQTLSEVEAAEAEALRSRDDSPPEAGPLDVMDCYACHRSNAASSNPPSVAPSSGVVA